MLSQMPESQFIEWLAYYQIEPFGILAEDLISAHGKALYANSNLRRGKTPKKTKDYMVFREKELDASELFEQDDEEL